MEADESYYASLARLERSDADINQGEVLMRRLKPAVVMPRALTLLTRSHTTEPNGDAVNMTGQGTQDQDQDQVENDDTPPPHESGDEDDTAMRMYMRCCAWCCGECKGEYACALCGTRYEENEFTRVIASKSRTRRHRERETHRDSGHHDNSED